MPKNIVILGAGFTGVLAAKKLSKHFKHNPDVLITLIDRHSYFTYLTQLHEVATERVSPESIQYDLQHIFSKNKNVQLVSDTITKIDTDKKVVVAENETYSFDSLLISMGGEPNDFGTPGVKENGFTLWSIEDAKALHNHIEETIAKGAIERDPAKRASLLSLVVCGSGFTGAETVGELIDYRKVLAAKNKIDPSEIKIILVEAAPAIVNMLNSQNAAHALAYFKKNNVDVRTNAQITKVNPDSIEIKGGTTIATNTLMWTAGVKSNHTADEFGIEAGHAGRLLVNEYLQAKDLETQSVYVGGDDSNATAPGAERAVPQTAQEAENEAAVAAHNIAADIDGNQNYEGFTDKNLGFTVSFGAYYGIAQLFKNTTFRGWFATLMKHGSYFLYFWRIKSGYALLRYILDEFFRVANHRTVFGDNTAKRTNVLWSVPLRLFFGLILFIDGLTAVGGSASFLSGMYSGAGWWEIILGAMIFLGLFSFIANLLMIVVFFASLMSVGTIWIPFVAFALLNGSGRSFGLDFWIIPAILKKWGNSRYGIPQAIYKK